MVAKLLRLTGFGYATEAFSRFSRLIGRLLRRQMQRTGEELSRDVRRVLLGAIVLGLGFIFALLSLLGVHVLAGSLMNVYFTIPVTVSILLGVDFLVTVVLFGTGLMLLKRPFLVDTRKEVVELFQLITEE